MPLDEHAERIDALMKAEDAFPAPERVRRAANLQDYAQVYRRSIEDPDGFWGDVAGELEWYEPWKRVREVKLPCTASGFLDTSLGYAARRSSCSLLASIGVR